jgi:hypothetical protein
MIDVTKFKKHYFNALSTDGESDLRHAFSRIVEGLQRMEPTKRQELVENSDVTFIDNVQNGDATGHFALGMILAGSMHGTQIVHFRIAETVYHWVTASPRDLANRLYFNIYGTSINGRPITD